MINAAGRIAKASTLLVAVLLPLQSFRLDCGCDARGGARRDGDSEARCCAAPAGAEGAASSHPSCCRSETQTDPGCCAGSADCGTTSAPVSDTTVDSTSQNPGAGVAVSAPAELLARRTAPLHWTTSPAPSASALDVCILLCRYRL